MSKRQWDNLLVLVTVYLVVYYISSYFEKVTEPNNVLFNNFIHYALLGYFSAKYWIFLIGLAVITNILQFIKTGFNINDLLKKGLIQIISAKFIGLLVGIILNWYYPMKINLWTVIKEVV